MKKIFTFLLFGIVLNNFTAQTLHESNKEIGVKRIKPSESLRGKVFELINTQTRFNYEEINHIEDEHFFETENGNITYGPEVEYFHYRMLFDKSEKWLETQELFHCDVDSLDSYNVVMPQIKSQISNLKKIAPCPYYYKITSENGTWFEFYIYSNKKQTKGTIYVFDKDLKLINSKKSVFKHADYDKINK
jgi:hypothetical protein